MQATGAARPNKARCTACLVVMALVLGPKKAPCNLSPAGWMRFEMNVASSKRPLGFELDGWKDKESWELKSSHS